MSTRRPLFALLAAAALAAPRAATQSTTQSTAQTTAPATEPLFELRARDPDLLTTAGMLLAAARPAWNLGPAAHGRLRIGDDLQVAEDTIDQPLPEGVLLQAAARPGAWIERVAAGVAAFEKAWGPRLAVIATQAGMPPADGKQLLAQLIAVARSVESAQLEVRRRGAAHDIALRLAPKAGTELQRWSQLLVPGKKGALATAAEGNVLEFAFDLAAERLAGLVDPMLPWIAAVSGNDAATLADMRRGMAAMDGSGSIAMGKDGMRVQFGLRDPRTYAEVAFSPASVERSKQQLARNRIDVEISPAAIRHRDVPAMKTVMFNDRPLPIPLFGDTTGGEIVSYTAVAGPCYLAVVGGRQPDAVMKGLIDAALDGKLPRRPLAAADADQSPPLLTMDLDIAQMIAMVPGGAGNRTLGADAPQRMHLSLHQTSTAIEIRIQLR